MDNETIDRIAHEVAHRTCTTYDHCGIERYSFSETQLSQFAHKFLGRIDAERGKNAAGEAFNLPGTMGGFTTCAFKSEDVPCGSKLFLSTTIPEGMANLLSAALVVVETHDEILPVMNSYMGTLGTTSAWEKTCKASDQLREAIAAAQGAPNA